MLLCVALDWRRHAGSAHAAAAVEMLSVLLLLLPATILLQLTPAVQPQAVLCCLCLGSTLQQL
jgi:hypothetical protein